MSKRRYTYYQPNEKDLKDNSGECSMYGYWVKEE